MNNEAMEEIIRQTLKREEDNSGALAQLKEVTQGLRRDMDRAHDELRTIRECVHEIQISQVQRNAIPMCTAPNKCLELERKLMEFIDACNARHKAVEEKVDMLNSERLEQKGTKKAYATLAALCGTFGGAAVTFIIWLWKIGQASPHTLPKP